MYEGYMNLNEGRLWFSVYGEFKSGVPVLVVHGGPGFRSVPDVICELSTDRPIYFYDQLGSGKSDRMMDPNKYCMTYFVEELEQVIRELHLSDVVLMGLSFGAAVVASYLLEKKPHGITGCVFSSPFFSCEDWQSDQKRNINQLPRAVCHVLEQQDSIDPEDPKYKNAMSVYYRRYICRMRPLPNPLRTAFLSLNSQVYRQLWGENEFHASGSLRDFDVSKRLREIKVPVLLTAGDQDEVRVETIAKYKNELPNAALSVFPNASRMHQFEQPDLYLATVTSFLKSL